MVRWSRWSSLPPPPIRLHLLCPCGPSVILCNGNAPTAGRAAASGTVASSSLGLGYLWLLGEVAVAVVKSHSFHFTHFLPFTFPSLSLILSPVVPFSLPFVAPVCPSSSLSASFPVSHSRHSHSFSQSTSDFLPFFGCHTPFSLWRYHQLDGLQTLFHPFLSRVFRYFTPSEHVPLTTPLRWFSSRSFFINPSPVH